MKKNEAGQQSNQLQATVSSSIRFSKMLPFIIIWSACFCVYYLFTSNTPPFGDDLFLKFVFQGWYVDTITAPRVTSFGQIIEGMTLFYNTFRGRVIAQGLCQIFAVFGKQYFNILNSLVFAGITFLVYFLSNYGKKANWVFYLMISVAFWFLTPDLMATSLWMIGSLSVFWPVFFSLLFLVPYRIIISDKGSITHSGLAAVFVMSTGFVAGAFNEQSFGLTVGFSVLTILLMLINKRKVPFWAIAGVISAICGTMFVLLAPGNKFECLRKYGYTPAGLYLHRFPGNIFDAVSVSFKVTKVLLFLTVAVLIWFIADRRKMASINLKKKKTGKATEQKWTFRAFISNKNVFLMPGAFLLIAVGSVVVATALPYFDSPRLFFAVFVCFSLVLFSLISEAIAHTNSSKNRLNKVLSKSFMRVAVPVFICLFAVFDVGTEFRVYHRNFVVYSDVVNSIEDRVAAGEKNIVIHRGTDIIPRLLEAGRLQNFIFYWSVTSVGNDTNALENKWYAYCLGADTLSGG